MTSLRHFREVWLVDFEYRQPDGERPDPVCMVAREFGSGATMRLWRTALHQQTEAPFGTGPDSLFVAFSATSELNCFLSLGWPMPARILDLYVEFVRLRNITRPKRSPRPKLNLLHALMHFGIDSIAAAEKQSMRALAMRGGDYTAAEIADLLEYCESDSVALARLLPAMLPGIDLPRALLRGRYMAAVARMEAVGVPIDVDSLATLRANWTRIQSRLIQEVDRDYGVYVPTDLRLIPDAIRQEAAESGLDPFALWDACRDMERTERDSIAEHVDAIKAARQQTGLTAARASRWENDGYDLAGWPGIDGDARELAGQYPALGIGQGYSSDTGYDDADYAGRLADLLRQPDPKPRRRTDPALIRDAAGLLYDNGSTATADGKGLSFSEAKFAEWLAANEIPWPRLESGELDTKEETFKEMAKAYPAVSPLRELRHSLSQLRLNELTVGSDGRNRCWLAPFRAQTGRNQPSNKQFIFGPSVWLRCLIRPQAGSAVAYLDFEQQEFGIAAALSGDGNMKAAYQSGDPYLAFAKQAGAVPADGTKETHGGIRELFKTAALAVQFGQGSRSLAQRLGKPECEARELLRLHKQTYPRYWTWSDAAVNHGMLRCWLQTTFGWRLEVNRYANPLSLANFPMQANGAEMLRLACCMATEAGIRVCAPVHDAILVEADADEIDSVVAQAQEVMREASAIVLDGFEIRTEAKIVRYPDRYSDPRGVRFWETVQGILATLEGVPPADTYLYHRWYTTCTTGGTPV